jgi:hypothetical protein
MKNILMIGSALMAGYAGFAVLPAQEFNTVVQTKDAKGTVVGVGALRNKPVIGAPFSGVAVTESTQTLVDGNRIVRTDQQKLYRDSQGRERRELGPNVSVLGQQVSVKDVLISDPVAGVNLSLNPELRSGQKRAAATNLMTIFERATVQMEAGGGRLEREQLPPTTIENVYALGTRTTQTIPAGKIGNERDIQVVDEVWYSPDLQMNVMTKRSDPRSGETTMRLTNIDRSEPDPALFKIPAGYTITEPRTATFYADPPPPPPPPK